MTETIGAKPDDLFDILRGVAVLTGHPIVAAMARTVARHPRADLAIAFNHKQIGSKLWLRDQVRASLGDRLDGVWILGGWHGVLAAILLNEPGFDPGNVASVDLDPGCAPVAVTLNAQAAAEGRFSALTADMNDLDYARAPELVINTSCEHLPDIPAWLAKIPKGQLLLLQSNDYFREPDHVSCSASLAAFQAQADLSQVLFAGQRPTKNYTRFMLIGRR